MKHAARFSVEKTRKRNPKTQPDPKKEKLCQGEEKQVAHPRVSGWETKIKANMPAAAGKDGV